VKAALALALAVTACRTPAHRDLPGASIAPHLASRPVAPACGDDVAMNGDAAPDIRYGYSYDALGRLVQAIGAYAAGAPDAVAYHWDHLDHMTHYLQTRGWGDARVEIVAEYDTLGELVDYTFDESAPGYSESWRRTYSTFTATGQPTRQVLAQDGQTFGFQLDYDDHDRIARVVQDGGGATTTYTYDDHGARTITIDTGNGAFHGVLEYDDQDHELSEVWGGSDPNATASETRYDWDGDRLLAVTYRYGTPLVLVETDTLRYDCGGL
jgi:YD repeat-containing protein